jgi:NTE family protein
MAILWKISARPSLRSCALTVALTGLTLLVSLSLVAQGPSEPGRPAADPPPAAARPRIGLVLEGGGALGLAHIGVIQWLEEHRIPVSYVAGTSMGGLVGGVYATGRNPAEVRQLVESIQWNTVLRGQVPFKNLTFRRKEDAYQYPGGIEFGLKKGLQFPGGFNSGQEVSFILDRVALPYSTIENFDEMPIPFACVGTDLIAARQHVFRSGSLSEALRSTMSLPGVFTPVRADGRVFADGGLLDNLPVDVAKQMGADIVVAVYLDAAPMGPDDQLSSFGVLGRSISVMIAANEVHSIAMADLLISVPVARFTTMDYSQAPQLIEAGYQAAQAKAAVLERFAVDQSTWNQYLADRNARRRLAPQPEFVDVQGTDTHSAKAIEKAFAPLVVGKPIDIPAIQNEIQNVQGDGRFSTLNYSIVDHNGTPGLQIKADEKSYAPPTIRPAIIIDGSNSNNVLFSLGARITAMNVGMYGAEWRNDVTIGAQYGLTSEYFRPVAALSKWYLAPRVNVQSGQFNAYTNSGTLGSVYRRKQFGGGLDIAYELGRSSEFRVGYQAEYFKYALQVGEITEPEVSGTQAFTQFRYTLLHVNDPVVPTIGQLGVFTTKWFNASPNNIKIQGGPSVTIDSEQHFPATEGSFTNYFPLNDRNSLFLAGGGGTVYNTSNISLPTFDLGGPAAFSAYGDDEILTNQYSYGQFGYLRELKELPPFLGGNLYFEGRLEIGSFQEIGTAVGQTAQYRVPADGSAGIVISTIFGPLLIGGAVGDAGHHRFYFGLGKIF